MGVDLSDGVAWGVNIGSGFEAQSSDLAWGVNLDPDSKSVSAGVEESVDEVVSAVGVGSQSNFSVLVDVN